MRQLLLLCLVFCGCANSGRSSKARDAATGPRGDMKALGELEDRRSLGDGRLMQTAITDRDPALRRRAFLALGRIQDPNTAGALVEGLSDPDPGVRNEAAFAIGLLGLSWAPLSDDVKTRLTHGLLDKEKAEEDAAVKLTLLEAMGRVATPPLVERLTDRLSVVGDVQGRAALSLGIAARAKAALPQRASSALGQLLKKENAAGTRYGGAYALMQSKQAAARPALLLCTGDEASDIRAVCAKGLGDIGTEIDAVVLKRLIDDSDYRVAVEATRSLAKLAQKCKSAACPARGALADLSFRAERVVRGDTTGGAQPILALAQQGLPPFGKGVLQALRLALAAAKTSTDEKVKKDAANLDCRLAAAMDRMGGSLVEVMGCGFQLVDEAVRLQWGLQAVKDTVKDRNKLLAETGSYVDHADARVKVAALELLGELKIPAAQDKVRGALLSDDAVVASVAATSSAKLNDKSQVGQIRVLAQKVANQVDVAPSVAEALATLDAKEAVADLESWLSSPHAAIRQAAAEALTKLKGQPVVAELVESPQAGTFQQPAREAKLLVVTEKGDFEVGLFTDDAPRTSANVVSLARKNFFRNLTFHRIVPDFVAQGGDPRGDGNGGPGYVIRCEVNRRPYTRGVVGMALSGKDTGGSQFFVTTSPQPHLDGRYTAFGEVLKGQEVIDALLEGDKILNVRAIP